MRASCGSGTGRAVDGGARVRCEGGRTDSGIQRKDRRKRKPKCAAHSPVSARLSLIASIQPLSVRSLRPVSWAIWILRQLCSDLVAQPSPAFGILAGCFLQTGFLRRSLGPVQRIVWILIQAGRDLVSQPSPAFGIFAHSSTIPRESTGGDQDCRLHRG